jgi:hypothetical protein
MKTITTAEVARRAKVKGRRNEDDDFLLAFIKFRVGLPNCIKTILFKMVGLSLLAAEK